MKNRTKLKNTLQKIIVVVSVVAMLCVTFVLPCFAYIPTTQYDKYIDAYDSDWNIRGACYGDDGTVIEFDNTDLHDTSYEGVTVGTNDYDYVSRAICYLGVESINAYEVQMVLDMTNFESRLTQADDQKVFKLTFGIWTRPKTNVSTQIVADDGNNPDFVRSFSNGTYISTGADVRGYYQLIEMYFTYDWTNVDYRLIIRLTPSSGDTINFSGVEPLHENSFIGITSLHYAELAPNSAPPYKLGTVLEYGEIAGETAYLLLNSEPEHVVGSFQIYRDGAYRTYSTNDYNNTTYFFNSDYSKVWVYVPTSAAQGFLYTATIGYGEAYKQLMLGTNDPIIMYNRGYADAVELYKSHLDALDKQWQDKYSTLIDTFSQDKEKIYSDAYSAGYASCSNSVKTFNNTIDRFGNLVKTCMGSVGQFSIYGVSISIIITGAVAIIATIMIVKKLR